MAIKKEKIRGRELTTTSAYEELIINNERALFHLKNVVIHNMSDDKIHVIINDGDKLSIHSNEMLSCGDIKVYSIIVVEEDSLIRYMGIQ